MVDLLPARPDGRAPSVVALGAHCDDIAIGAGGTLLSLLAAHPGLQLTATVLSSTPERAAEERAALQAFVPGAEVEVHDLPDGRLPANWDRVKDLLQAAVSDADLVLAPSTYDAHQDHRLIAELVPTAFRRHLVLGYEILKWDGDLGRPNVHVPLTDAVAEQKWELLRQHYPSQLAKDWFDREALLGLLRVRGVEAHTRYAEAFSCAKMSWLIGGST